MGGVLKPVRRDGHGDIVYRYAAKGEGGNGEMERK